MAQELEFVQRKDGLHIGADGVVIINAAELRDLAAIGGCRRQGCSRVFVAGVDHPHQVFFFHQRILANELARHTPILREYQKAGGVDVQSAGGHQAFELAGVKEEARIVFGPAVLRLNQDDGWLVPVFGLAADQTQRLVDEHGHLVCLLALRLLGDFDLDIGFDLHAHGGHDAIHLDPALANPFIGLAARRQAQFGHALVQTQGAVGAQRGGVGLANGQGSPAGWWRGTAKGGRSFGCISHLLFI